MMTVRSIRWATQGGIVMLALALLGLAAHFHQRYADLAWATQPPGPGPQDFHDRAWLCCYAILGLALISAVTKRWIASVVCLIVFAVGFWSASVTF